jgi:hypothetical protein
MTALILHPFGVIRERERTDLLKPRFLQKIVANRPTDQLVNQVSSPIMERILELLIEISLSTESGAYFGKNIN